MYNKVLLRVQDDTAVVQYVTHRQSKIRMSRAHSKPIAAKTTGMSLAA